MFSKRGKMSKPVTHTSVNISEASTSNTTVADICNSQFPCNEIKNQTELLAELYKTPSEIKSVLNYIDTLPCVSTFKWDQGRVKSLYVSMMDLFPIGIDRNLSMLVLREKVSMELKANIPSSRIWDYLSNTWNLVDSDDKRSFSQARKTFALPNEYNELIDEEKEKILNEMKGGELNFNETITSTSEGSLVLINESRMVDDPCFDDYGDAVNSTNSVTDNNMLETSSILENNYNFDYPTVTYDNINEVQSTSYDLKESQSENYDFTTLSTPNFNFESLPTHQFGVETFSSSSFAVNDFQENSSFNKYLSDSENENLSSNDNGDD